MPVEKENKKKYPIYSEESPSGYFEQSFRGGGTCISIDCGCGRVHFCPANSAYEEGQYERLCQLEKEDPEGYIESEYDSVSYVWLGGVCVVYGCPCNRATAYEQFILHHSSDIGEFFETQAVALKLQSDNMDKINRATKAYNILKIK